ncbi:MAG: hypothetical protein KZQ94_17925 [Candidatus Thiodiazotropha sp. (ex Troendleina suluensis)]|nr:hypothetical protein [Candidatus Thiodiazotropha sp. (ex Troendleina suluensis)]
MNSLGILLSRLNIKHVYWIDDENASIEEMDVNKLVESLVDQLLVSNSKEQEKSTNQLRKYPNARELADKIDRILQDQEDGNQTSSIIELLERELDKAVDDVKLVLLSMLSALPQPLEPQQREGILEIFKTDTNWELSPMSFSNWKERSQEILNQHKEPDVRALLIVDLQNTRESTSMSGSDILQEWANHIKDQKNDKGISIYAVAFTSTYKERQELLQSRKYTRELFGDEATPSLPILIIAKERLTNDGEDGYIAPIANAFISSLARLRSFTLHAKLSCEISTVFKDTVSGAFDRLQNLTIEELLYSVSSTSYHEGISEIDTLIRMASIAQREALMNSLSEHNNIQSTLIELRGLHDLTGFVEASDIDSIDGIESLRQSELHEPPLVINSLLSPLAPGDIFLIETDGQEQYFILATNACDMMLRGDTGKRAISDAVALKLHLDTGSSVAKNLSYFISHFPMSSPLHGSDYRVDLRCPTIISLDILDLCWTNTSGECVWQKDNIPSEQLSFLPAQTLRYNELCKKYSSEEFTSNKVHLTPWIVRNIEYEEASGNISKIQYSVKRIGRLSSDSATDLLHQFAATLSRPSKAHNFSATR